MVVPFKPCVQWPRGTSHPIKCRVKAEPPFKFVGGTENGIREHRQALEDALKVIACARGQAFGQPSFALVRGGMVKLKSYENNASEMDLMKETYAVSSSMVQDRGALRLVPRSPQRSDSAQVPIASALGSKRIICGESKRGKQLHPSLQKKRGYSYDEAWLTFVVESAVWKKLDPAQDRGRSSVGVDEESNELEVHRSKHKGFTDQRTPPLLHVFVKRSIMNLLRCLIGAGFHCFSRTFFAFWRSFCGSHFLSITLLSCSFQSASSILVSLELLSLVSRDLATLFFSNICPTPGAFSKVCCSFLLLLTPPWEHLLFTSCTAPVFRRGPFVERFARPAATVGGDEVGSDPDDA